MLDDPLSTIKKKCRCQVGTTRESPSQLQVANSYILIYHVSFEYKFFIIPCLAFFCEYCRNYNDMQYYLLVLYCVCSQLSFVSLVVKFLSCYLIVSSISCEQYILSTYHHTYTTSTTQLMFNLKQIFYTLQKSTRGIISILIGGGDATKLEVVGDARR